jgi:hypothetical protein
MPSSAKSAPFSAMTDSERPTRLSSMLVSIWIRPHATLESLTYASGWSWIVPIGFALILFYASLFTMAFLKAPITLWMLLGGLVGILLGWPLRALVLAGVGLLLGARLPFAASFTLSTWAALPLVVRAAVQLAYMLSTRKLLEYPGLSGLLAQPASMADTSVVMTANWTVVVAQVVLGNVDVYTLWFLILLVQTVSIAAQIPRWRAVVIVAIYSGLSLAVGCFVALLAFWR